MLPRALFGLDGFVPGGVEPLALLRMVRPFSVSAVRAVSGSPRPDGVERYEPQLISTHLSPSQASCLFPTADDQNGMEVWILGRSVRIEITTEAMRLKYMVHLPAVCNPR